MIFKLDLKMKIKKKHINIKFIIKFKFKKVNL